MTDRNRRSTPTVGSKEWFLDVAWRSHPRMVRVLALLSAVAIILATATEAVAGVGVVLLLVSFLLLGGIVLLLQSSLSMRRRRDGRSATTRLLRFLRALGVFFLGVVLVSTALLLQESYQGAGQPKPISTFLVRLGAKVASAGGCELSEPPVFVEGTPETLDAVLAEGGFSPPPETSDRQLCTELRKRRALRLSGHFDWSHNPGRELWASAVEIPAGSQLILGSGRLAIHAIELRGNGAVVAWPEEMRGAAGPEPGADGLPGAQGGDLVLDIRGRVAGQPQVDLRGQRGGNGARGAKGEKGATGSRGSDAAEGFLECKRGGGDGGKGGPGGTGGTGGNGGRGGDGGTLFLPYAPTYVQALSAISCLQAGAPGGAAGEGGQPGDGGDGGRGGGGKGLCGGGHNGPPGEPGQFGSPGDDGKPGSPPKVYPDHAGAPQDHENSTTSHPATP